MEKCYRCGGHYEEDELYGYDFNSYCEDCYYEVSEEEDGVESADLCDNCGKSRRYYNCVC